MVILVGAFSVTAHAEESIQDNYTILQQGSLRVSGESHTLSWLEFSQEDKNGNAYVMQNEGNWLTYYTLYDSEYWQDYKIYNTDQSYIMHKDKNYKVKLNQFYFSAYVEAFTSYYVRNPKEVVGWVTYSDNTTESISIEYTHSSNTPLIDFNFSFTPAKDVKSFEIRVKASTRDVKPTSNGLAKLTSYYGFLGDSTYQFIVDIQTEEAGLLQGIGDKLTSGFSALGDKLSNVVNGILELPQKLWNLISDGLKGLFVPSTEEMTEYKDKWDTLLADRFGVLYQVANVLFESFDGVMSATLTETVYIPYAEISLPGGVTYGFGGYTVDIVPDGFEFFQDMIRLAVGMVCSILFVNSMRKRYDEIMGG